MRPKFAVGKIMSLENIVKDNLELLELIKVFCKKLKKMAIIFDAE